MQIGLTPYLPLYYCLALCSVAYADLRCSSRENVRETIYRRLGTKTPYRHIEKDVSKYLTQPEGCTVSNVWGLFRHGTRNPSNRIIEHMHTTLVELQATIVRHGRMCADDLQKMKAWHPSIGGEQAKLLVEEGAAELRRIGQRFRKRFGSAIPNDYSDADFLFKYTQTERAEFSAKNFTLGLFGRVLPIEYAEPSTRDPVLRFYKLCPRWRMEVKKNPQSYKQVNKFMNSTDMSSVISRIAKMVGRPVTAEEVHVAYQACAFETAWNDRDVSPWCLLFDKASIAVLEYREDLKYYWIDGYGYELTYAQACTAFVDMLAKFDNPQEPAFVFYFTHSGTLLKSLAFLDLYKDKEPLRAHTFHRKRKWRVSHIDAFASNLYFVLFDCKNGTKRISLFHQERPTPIPGCPEQEHDHHWCDYELFKQLYAERIVQCDFRTMCSDQEVPLSVKDEL